MIRIFEIASATLGVRDVRATRAFYRDVFNSHWTRIIGASGPDGEGLEFYALRGNP